MAIEFITEPVPALLAKSDPAALYTIPVLVIRFIPKAGRYMDPLKAPGYFDLNPILLSHKIAELDRALFDTRLYFESGTRYRAYKDPSAVPSITYPVAGIYTVYDLPPASNSYFSPSRYGDSVPYPDWFQVLEAINAEEWVEEKGVRQIWVWSTHYMGDEPSYDPQKIPKANLRSLCETNMAGPFGNISNSYRYRDMPEFLYTYTLYEFNLHRSVNENVHNHIHQIEALLNHVEGKHKTPEHLYPQLLFWGRFVGADATGRLTEPRRCGWCHYPPNANKDYCYDSMDTVLSDIEDWTPNASGKFSKISAKRWNRVEALWHQLWMQTLPGHNNTLRDNGKPLTNWWRFIADWDMANMENAKLVED